MTIVRSVLFMTAVALPCAAAEPRDSQRCDGWILLVGHETEMSGSTADLVHARKLAGDGPALWVRRQDKEWLVRDPGVIARGAG